MYKILLLYDTQEQDFARDLQDLINELGCEVLMIPKAPNLGRTLQAKEDGYFAVADGAIFLITPGADRNGQAVPSPSVADEMGRAREQFKSTPEAVIYLVQAGCQIQAVDQACYIHFQRENIRSVVSAITDLVRNLKAAGFVGRPRQAAQAAPAPRIDLGELSQRLDHRLMKICVKLSEALGGTMMHKEFVLHLVGMGFSKSEINFAKRDLTQMDLIRIYPPRPIHLDFATITLTDLGFELVRHELTNNRPGVLR